MDPEGPLSGLWRVVKKSGCIYPSVIGMCVMYGDREGQEGGGGTFNPRAKRVKILSHVLRHRVKKWLMSCSWDSRDGGRGCWALPFWNSPKFMPLYGILLDIGC